MLTAVAAGVEGLGESGKGRGKSEKAGGGESATAPGVCETEEEAAGLKGLEIGGVETARLAASLLFVLVVEEVLA